ncbi:MAG: hypothetical protein M0R06_03330 [Sphaerochaeta sp.]|jgi:hypothetical protein|nr:hypothetical protein [Candidatus Neomarinimicrobiota bacterium]MCK9598046.1 hypothetical protein [Sphaerochaeta sp.]
MAKYRKKQVEIEAFQWNGERPLPHPLEGNWDNNPMTPDKVTIKTLEGRLEVSIGDWIIKGIKGEYYPCKPDIFELTYEAL